jgi:post-segregation antitoxin (ccd killing protein)
MVSRAEREEKARMVLSSVLSSEFVGPGNAPECAYEPELCALLDHYAHSLLRYAPMNVNVYLPDDLGKRAKDEDLPFSQLLRDAVAAELERREAMTAALKDAQTIELDLTDRDDNPYTGRLTGALIYGDGRSEIYVTDDERVIVYDSDKADYWIVDDPQTELVDWPDALRALGIRYVVDI